MVVSTRTHVFVSFANPYLVCDQCLWSVPRWHNNDKCGCDASWWNEPCGHKAEAVSICPSWSPVDGCLCAEHLGYVGHVLVDESAPKGNERSGGARMTTGTC